MHTPERRGSSRGVIRSTTGARPISVMRSRRIAAPAHAVYRLLSNPEHIARAWPGIRRMDILSRHASHATVRMVFSLAGFPAMPTEGTVSWDGSGEIRFTATHPLEITTLFGLMPDGDRTQLTMAMTLDVSPLMGALSAFIPHERIAGVIGPELDTALARVAHAIENDTAATRLE